MPAGRPTNYRDHFPEQLIEHMARGKSFESFGAYANCGVSTLYDWVDRHEEFSEAKSIGELKSLDHWEEIASAAAFEKSYNAAIIIYTMKCRFRKYGWADSEKIQQQINIDSGKAQTLDIKEAKKLIESDPGASQELITVQVEDLEDEVS